MKKRAMPEADIQRNIVIFLRAVLPKGSIVHHAANEIASGSRAGRARQAILVGMGVYPGFSDLVVISEGKVLFLEVKSRTGTLRQAQEEFRDAVIAQGLRWALVRSIEDVMVALRYYHFATRVAGGL